MPVSLPHLAPWILCLPVAFIVVACLVGAIVLRDSETIALVFVSIGVTVLGVAGGALRSHGYARLYWIAIAGVILFGICILALVVWLIRLVLRGLSRAYRNHRYRGESNPLPRYYGQPYGSEGKPSSEYDPANDLRNF